MREPWRLLLARRKLKILRITLLYLHLHKIIFNLGTFLNTLSPYRLQIIDEIESFLRKWIFARN